LEIIERYDNNIIIIQNHLNKYIILLKFPEITKDNKADSTKKFIWHIQTHVCVKDVGITCRQTPY